MHRKLTLAFFLFGSVCLPLSSSIGQESTEGKVFKDILRETSKELSDEEIREIAAIRDQLGGGTGLELDKLFSEPKKPAKAAEMRSEPKQSAAGRGLPRAGTVEISLSKSTVASQLFLQAANGKVSGNGKLNSNGKVNSVNSSAQSNVELIRSLASRIDNLASELEQLALYEDADFLRQRARGVRLQARETERKTRTAELRRAVGR